MDLVKASEDLRTLEQDRSLNDETRFAARSEVLDRIDFIRKIAAVQGNGTVVRRATVLKERLEAANQRLLRRLRADIRSDGYDPAVLRQVLDQQTGYTSQERHYRHASYEPLDELLSGLLLADATPAETIEREPEMVHYEPAPASVVLELMDQIHFAADDVFYDLGSGLGQVVLLVHLLSGVAARGVEIEPAYCAHARRCAEQLKLDGVDFVQADARSAPLRDGTIFFLYSPFWGEILSMVLRRLYDVAQQQTIRIAAFGPCVRRIARQLWLHRTNASIDEEFSLAIFESC